MDLQGKTTIILAYRFLQPTRFPYIHEIRGYKTKKSSKLVSWWGRLLFWGLEGCHPRWRWQNRRKDNQCSKWGCLYPWSLPWRIWLEQSWEETRRLQPKRALLSIPNSPRLCCLHCYPNWWCPRCRPSRQTKSNWRRESPLLMPSLQIPNEKRQISDLQNRYQGWTSWCSTRTKQGIDRRHEMETLRCVPPVL